MITKKDIGRRVFVAVHYDCGDSGHELGVIVDVLGGDRDGDLWDGWVVVVFDGCPPVSRSCLGPEDPKKGFFTPADTITFVADPEEGHNNGGSTDYYKFNPKWRDCQDVIEDRKMNFAQGNIFKSAFCFNTGRHEASNYKRELYKIKWFVDRELNRIKVN